MGTGKGERVAVYGKQLEVAASVMRVDVLVISRSSRPAPFNSSADGGGASAFVTGTTRPLFPIGAPSLMPVLLGIKRDAKKETGKERGRDKGRNEGREGGTGRIPVKKYKGRLRV